MPLNSSPPGSPIVLLVAQQAERAGLFNDCGGLTRRSGAGQLVAEWDSLCFLVAVYDAAPDSVTGLLYPPSAAPLAAKAGALTTRGPVYLFHPPARVDLRVSGERRGPVYFILPQRHPSPAN